MFAYNLRPSSDFLSVSPPTPLMPFAFLLALVAVAGGALASYLYDRAAPPPIRLCEGACTGFAVLGLVGFVFASLLGLTPLALGLSGLVVASPLALLLNPVWRSRARADAARLSRDLGDAVLRPGEGKTGVFLFYALAALLLWSLFGRVLFERGGEIYTGVDNALGDLPFHLSIITSFAYGDNFPPVHPEFAGARLTYPFLIDFLAAMFVRAGASLRGAFFWQNFVLALALTGLLHRWARVLTRDRAAALLVPVLVLLGGGFGWWRLVREWSAGNVGLIDLLMRLPHDYTIGGGDDLYRWGNALTTLFIPQRTLLLGVPLALIVWTLWWRATEEDGAVEEEDEASAEAGKRLKKRSKGGEARMRSGRSVAASKAGKRGKGKKRGARAGRSLDEEVDAAETTRAARRVEEDATDAPPPAPAPRLSLPSIPAFSPPALMLAAGVLTGLFPLVHAHTYVVLMAAGGVLALVFRERWRAWAYYFAASLVVAAPQLLWVTRGTAVRSETFFGWALGWDHGGHNVVWFWLVNTGLFIPALVAAILWRRPARLVGRKLLWFYLPFAALCFVLPNLFKFSPYVWDNIKLLLYWWIASTPLVALLVVRLWRGRSRASKLAAAALVAGLTLAGSLDVWRVVSKASEQREFDRDGVALAELIKRETPPRSLILHAPTYNHPVFLTGRQSVMGYAGHLWTHGLKYEDRWAEVQRIYAGGADAGALLQRHGIAYVVVGPLERASMKVNENFFARYAKVGETGAYRLYKTARP